mgnify:CR=1 FL=1
MKDIKTLKEADRPRERLLFNGAESLSDLELLTVILGSGMEGMRVSEIAAKVLALIDLRNGSLQAGDLCKIKGIGMAKAALVCAALEFSRRRIITDGTKIKEASDVYALLRHYAEKKQEHFICLSLNGANEVIALRVVTIGLVNSTQVHPREVFADPICERAASVIVAHNHPSGQLVPSEEDLKVTQNLKSASRILGIKLLDHVIFSRHGFISFQEKGLL